jgi:hypothetical protein
VKCESQSCRQIHFHWIAALHVHDRFVPASPTSPPTVSATPPPTVSTTPPQPPPPPPWRFRDASGTPLWASSVLHHYHVLIYFKIYTCVSDLLVLEARNTIDQPIKT